MTRLLDGATSKLRAMILLASLAGLRCCEVASLRVEDVLVGEGLLRVVGKGDRERAIPAHPEVLKALAALPEPSGEFVFGMSAGAVSHAIGGLMHKLGIRGGAHRLRHWNATRLHAQDPRPTSGPRVPRAQRPATTAIYAGSAPSRWDGGSESTEGGRVTLRRFEKVAVA